MIIALLALASAMILGGFLSIFFGWDIVLVERGWTMVLAGSISAAGGALLLGVTAAVSKLARIHTEIARLHGALQARGPDAAMQVAPPPLLEPSATALAGGAAADVARNHDEIEPLLPFADQDRSGESVEGAADRDPDLPEHTDAVVPFRPRIYSEPPPPVEEEAFAGKVPDFLLGDRLRDADEEPRVSEPDESPPEAERAADEPEEKTEAVADAPEDVTPAAWSPVDAEVSEVAETAEPDPVGEPEPAPEEPRPATIIGTYNSGENRYVMFSDGSIEAETPGGVFRFKSLDELKEFIASGGEGGSTAA